MKTLFGLFLVFCLLAGRAESAEDDGALIGDRPHIFLELPAFPDGIHVTFFYKADPQNTIFINFYDKPDIDTQMTGNILAQLRVAPSADDKVVSAQCMQCKPSQAIWTNQDERKTPITGPGAQSAWWRVDVYKIDNQHMLICLQGFWSDIRTFKSSLGAAKSVYVFGAKAIDKDNVYIKYRLPSYLVKPIPFKEFNTLLIEEMLSGSAQAPHTGPPRDTSFNTVKLFWLPVGYRLLITAWLGSAHDRKAGNPMLQFVPATEEAVKKYDKDSGVHSGVLTIYQEWDTNPAKGRKTYLNLFDKKKDAADVQSDWIKPHPCIVDGSASDLQHFLIERLAIDGSPNQTIRVTSYYLGPDVNPDEGKFGTACTMQIGPKGAAQINTEMKIHGYNGATILHADALWT